MLCKNECTVEEARTPSDPPERYAGYADGERITTYYLFRYNESVTEYARIGRLLYGLWKGGDGAAYRISDVVFTENITLSRRYFTVTLDREGEEALRAFLEREGADGSLVEIVAEDF